MTPAYTELHAHSAFSFLDGASLPEELAEAAAARGHRAIALTDHDNLCGAMEFAQAAKVAGIRAIHGVELTVRAGCREGDDPPPDPKLGEPPNHLTLLAENATGWRSLCRIVTEAHSRTRDGRPGAPATAPVTDLQTVMENSKGLVCLTGCADHGVRDAQAVAQLLEAFGPDHLRVELQRPFHRGDRDRNSMLKRLAGRFGLQCVTTGNVHVHDRSRAQLQDAFVAVRSGSALDSNEPLRRGNSTHALAPPEAMAARFADHPDAVAESSELADRLSFDLTRDLGYRYPREGDASADRELAEVCRAMFGIRYGKAAPLKRAEAAARLDEELNIIEGLGLAGFFLLHRDLLELAREVAVEVRGPSAARALLPPGRGRGSSVSSIVCHLTGLSHIDPIEAKLCLGRFLNDGLTTVPDIDLDFPRDIRARLIPRIHGRYGKDRTALVAAFPTYRARSAIRDLGGALGLPAAEIERVARASEGWSGKAVAGDIATVLGDAASANPRWQWLARLSAEAHGLPRHISQHSGGMIVATEPLTRCCPIIPSATPGRRMVQWDKDSCADAGFLKIDLLGLGMLSAVERCVDHIATTKGEAIDLSRIPLDDAPTFEAIRRAETTGVFQIESRAQMSSLLRTRPRNLDDITIQVAIVRPGPIQGGAVNPYIRRRQMLAQNPDAEIDYIHPSLKEPLGETLGTIIFQDQVLEVAVAFAGFTPAEAEGLRRAMSRKRSSAAVEAHRLRFIEGAARLHGASGELAQRVFEMIRGFSGFGFPKAHSAAFGLLAYQSTWLRVHHPAEFLCALLDEQPMGFYPPDSLVHEAQRRGVTVLPVDVNRSGVDCTVEQGLRLAHGSGSDGRRIGAEPAAEAIEGEGPHSGWAVRLGMLRVAGVGRDCAQAIVANRDAGYTSTTDLAARSGAGRQALEALAWAGACDRLSGSRRAALWELGVGPIAKSGSEGTQLALPLDAVAPGLAPLDAWGRAMADYATTGVAIEGNPVGLLRQALPGRAVTAAQLPRLRHGSDVMVAGLVVARQRPGTAGGIVFLLIEDETGTINVVIKPKVYEQHRLIARAEPLLLVEGRLERPLAAGGGISIVATRMRRIERVLGGSGAVRDLFDRDLEPADAERLGAHHVPRASSGRRGR